MKVFEDVQSEVLSYFSGWIKIRDYRSKWTIEDFPYERGVDEALTSPHCWECVTVNKCWFKDEEGKKPKEFDNSRYSLIDLPLSKRGLYHPNCHCWKHKMPAPRREEIKLIIPSGKIQWFYKDKAGLAKAWGYENDKEQFKSNLERATIEAYISGKYIVHDHSIAGVNLTIFIEMCGINNKSGHLYKRITSYMVYPNGKLKNNTPIGDKWE